MMTRLCLIFICICFFSKPCKSTSSTNEPTNTIFTDGLSPKELAILFSQNISGPIIDTVTMGQTQCFHQNNVAFTDDYVIKEARKIKKSRISLVSLPRMIASLWLTRAALNLPVEGDIVETGIYKGGTSILLIRTLLIFGACRRHFWGFDSFQGLPASVPQDTKGRLSRGSQGQYSASEATFYENLHTYNAYNENIVHITKGFFNVTLPTTPIKSIVFLRLDGDVFTSTWDALLHLYPKVVPGGYIYIDDYDSFNGCKLAVDMYREQNQITEPLTKVLEGKLPHQKMKREFEAVWWRKRMD